MNTQSKIYFIIYVKIYLNNLYLYDTSKLNIYSWIHLNTNGTEYPLELEKKNKTAKIKEIITIKKF